MASMKTDSKWFYTIFCFKSADIFCITELQKKYIYCKRTYYDKSFYKLLKKIKF